MLQLMKKQTFHACKFSGTYYDIGSQLGYIKANNQLPEYKQYSEEDKELLEYWFTANGLSYGRALDDQSDYVHKTKREINKNKSRRVEFRLITAGEEMLEEFVEKQNKV